MISVFDLATAMNESANHSGGTNIRPMEIPQSFTLVEAIQYANAEVMAEAASFDTYSLGVDEVLFEAVAMRSENTGIISENVIKNLFAQVGKFFGRIIAAVKAILNKIKGFFSKVEETTESWASKIQPRLQNASGNAPVDVTMYNWDEKGISTDMIDIASSVAEVATGAKGTMKDHIKAETSQYSAWLKGVTEENKQMRIDSFEKQIENIKKANEDYKVEIIKAAGYPAASTAEGLWKALETAVKGGEKQSTVRVDNAKANAMFKFVTSSGEKGKYHTTMYNNFLSRLSTLKNEWEKALDEVEKEIETEHGNKVPADVLNKYQEFVRGKAQIMMSVVSLGHSLVSGLQSRNVTYLKDCTREYMGAVTKYVGGTQAKGHVVVHQGEKA